MARTRQKDAVLIRELSDTDRLCFRCPLPECDEDDPRCPYRRAGGRGLRRRRSRRSSRKQSKRGHR
jgi:hypothetical protein